MHIPERAALAPPRRRGRETDIQAINRLEEERRVIWGRGCSQPGDRDRLAEINTDLRGHWESRRREQARGRG